jgi:hypothetical protein
MSKSTKYVADETYTIQISKKEWNDMYDENKKTFENYHGLLHQRLFERLGGCCRSSTIKNMYEKGHNAFKYRH